jgi:hypothetical protein
MPTKSRPAALPLLSWQGPSLCICQEWIYGGVFLAISIHGVEFFTNTGKSLAIDICSHGIRIKLAARPAPRFRESVSLFEKGIRNRNRGFHEHSITVVIPGFKRDNPESRRDFAKGFFAPWRMSERLQWRSFLRRQPPTKSGAGDGNRTRTGGWGALLVASAGSSLAQVAKFRRAGLSAVDEWSGIDRRCSRCPLHDP